MLQRYNFWIPLFIGLLLLGIFYNLWERPLFGVEGRWAEAAREMTLRGSWFVPTLNFEPHVTKPLIPFWLIKISGELFGYSEFTVRLPGALLSLFSLFVFYLLTKKLFARDWAIIGTALYGVSLGFLQFSRLAQSEIYQLFGIVAGIAVYVYYRDKTSLKGYLLFIISLLFGALSKGLTAVAVLSLFVMIDVVTFKRFYHFNLKFFLALILGIGLYFFPYYLTSRELQGELPFYLWFRENLKQAVDPYDNLRPFYIYFYFWPLWIAPFSLFLPFLLYNRLRNFKSLSGDERSFLLASIFIFWLFCLVKARRGYYILPILPFTVIALTFYLKDLKKTTLLKMHAGIAYFLPLGTILGLYLLHQKGYPLTREILTGLLLTIALQGLLILRSQRVSEAPQKIINLLLIFLLSEILYFSFLQPVYSSTTEKEAGQRIQTLLKNHPQARICSLSPEEKPVANFYFYARIQNKVEEFRDLNESIFNCDAVVVRKHLREEWIRTFQARGFKLVRFESQGDRAKNYYILYNSSTLKTPSF